ncbi:MAG: hypothetical protein P9L92_19945 [Candidatus Electryonea clarkiae]|nr:hypothetical protein [Candidatus Electryonea clarkiae]MDP8285402.1 hypothetical protein [Candidatus Electryonea clarkiae]
MIIKKIKLMSRKLDALEKTYADQFQFPIVERDVNRMDLQVGNSILSFNRADMDTIPYYHFAIGIPSKCLQQAKLWLSARAQILGRGNEKEFFYSYLAGAQAVFFTDASENIGELVSRRERPEFDDRAFSLKNLLGITEIGLPVNDVDSARDQIAEAFGLQDSVIKLPQFTAIGNFEGSIDIVPVGRNWLPTEKGAALFPLEVTILGDEEKSFTLPDHPYTFHMVKE